MRVGTEYKALLAFLWPGPRACQVHLPLSRSVFFLAIVLLCRSAIAADNIAPPHDRQLPDATTLRASLGYHQGQNGFNPAADINGDGTINAQDVALFKLAKRDGRLPSRTVGVANTVAGTERIIIQTPFTTVRAGQTASVLFLLRDNTMPLSGYTIDVDIVAVSGAMGAVTANVSMTNFFDQQNLITACPLATCPTGPIRDPLFSVITNNGIGGVSITTNTDDFSTVLAADDVNDVFTQVFFDVPLDALGDFTIQLGSSTALIDGNAASVSFESTPGMIRVLDPNVVPTVSEWGVIVMSLLIVTAGCVVFAKRNVAIGLVKDGSWNKVRYCVADRPPSIPPW